MRRRAFLTWAGTATLAGIAGCTVGSSRDDPGRTDAPRRSTPTGSGGPTTSTPERASELAGESLPIPASDLVRAAPEGSIPAITEPAVADDWSDLALTVQTGPRAGETIRPRLAPGDGVIGVVRDGRSRAYPLQLLAGHEIVNDDLGGPLLVTYCPVCASGVVAVRRVHGEETTFEVSGRLWKSNLVAVDRATGSFWSQLYATAISGRATGLRLSQVPASLTTWGEWRRARADTDVVLPPPHSDTTAGEVPLDYTGYEGTYDDVRPGDVAANDGGLHPKTIVLGVAHGGQARAYPLPEVLRSGVVNDVVGDLPVVVTAGPDDALFGYVRRIDGETLSFAADGPRHLRAGGTRWRRVTGEAVAGRREGSRLGPASDLSPLFWTIWNERHPETSVYGPSTP